MGSVPDLTRDVGKPFTSAELILWGFVSGIAALILLIYTVVGTGNRGVVAVLAALLGVAVVAAIVFALWSPALKGRVNATFGHVIGTIVITIVVGLGAVLFLFAVCASMIGASGT
jgi:hypothetical protein